MGDTFISTGGMQLILDSKTKTAGRGIYNRLLHIWDKTSGELASFSSNFSFLIDIDGYADGFTFFLAENNSVATIGSALGLPVDYSSYKMLNSFVAVEFDAHTDTVIWDQTPEDYHVGINVNSVSSSVWKNWSFNFSEGAHCQASVMYDSVSKNLSVSVTDDISGVIDLNYIIDLRYVLPEKVIFGFSAGFEKVTLISWSFSSSNLQVDEEKAQPPGSTNQDPVKDNKRTGHKVGLIAGLVVAVLSFSAIVASYYLWRTNKHRRDEVGYVLKGKD